MVTPNATQCQDEIILQRLLSEQLSASEETAVLAHIESCELCRDRLAKLAGHGELEPEIRKHLSSGVQIDPGEETLFHGELDEGAEVAEVEQIKTLLAPTDDPHMLGRIGHYEISGVVGRGSTGIVFKALDKRLNRFVAIKMLAPSYAGSGATRQRFEREARSIAAVRDEHVIPVFAVDEHKSLPFIVMEYMPAGSLAQRIEAKGTLDTCEVVRIGMQIARALDAAHAQGIVHRDVKPANVLLETGIERALVTDFGLARVLDEASMTRSGAISGTPQFMSPEQASGEIVDHRSDLFSLGSVMYMACTGHSPFRSETVFGVIKRVCETEPRPIRETNPDIHAWLGDFIAKLHAKNPADRFQSAKEVADHLAEELAYLQSPTSQTQPERAWQPAQTSAGLSFFKRRAVVLTSFGAIMGLSFLFVFSQIGQEGSEPLAKSEAGTSAGDFLPKEFAALGFKTFVEELASSARDQESERISAAESTWSTEEDQDAFDKANESFAAEDYRNAIKYFNIATADDRGGTAEYNIACCYALMNQPDDAFPWLQKAFTAGFCDADHYRADDDLKSLRKDERFKKLLARIESHDKAEELTSKGIALRQQGRLKEAEKLYLRVLEDHPEHEHAILEQGLTLHMQGRLDEAIVWHHRAARSKDYDHFGFYNIACYHSLKGNPEQAFVFFEKAIDAGMVDIMHFEEDDDLDAIRDDSRYEQMLRLAEKHQQSSWSESEKSCYELVEAIRDGKYGQIKNLLAKTSPDLSMPQCRLPKRGFSAARWTPLCEAASLGDLESVKLLVGAGANTNSVDGSTPTPLMVAADEGHTRIIQFLIAQGADVNSQPNGASTPLLVAVQSGSKDGVIQLLGSGADINLAVPRAGTPLSTAASDGQLEMMRLLIESKADIDAATKDVGTALCVAAKQGQVKAAKLLLDAGADPDRSIPGVATPLALAVQHEQHEMVRLLLEHGANRKAKSPGSKSAIALARECCDDEMVKLIFQGP